ncbi:hypothetical protein RIF29_07738 [Crotalaria pallida]|uniref:MAPK kinase substrate protein n=1 Tax=Crotalaria pallida TaxID=3830 RepID=A0AAN9J4N2_CROPI
MADQTGLQRSVTSFRRQGSSGLVWDDKFIQKLNQQQQEQDTNNNNNQREEQEQKSAVGSSATLERSRSAGSRPYRTVNVAPPSVDPPSPKVATCGLCGFFGKKSVPDNNSSTTHKSKPKSRKSR